MTGDYQRICAWGGPAAVVLTFGGMLLAGLFPPPPPSWDATRMPGLYLDHSVSLRLGAILIMCAIPALAAFTAVIGVQMKRIEGADSPMTYAQMLAGAIGLVPFICAPVFWCAAAFRMDRAPETMLLLNDLGWLTFIMIGSPFVLQVSALGFAILKDKRPQPIFPRWLAYLSFWIALLTFPGMVTSLFQVGPFAWNGLFAFWLAASIFGIWLLAVFGLLLSAIKRQEQEGTVS